MKADEIGIYRVAGMDGYGRLRPPFDPPRAYAELSGGVATDPSNFAYDAFRDFLRLLGWDREHQDTPGWNPFGWLIRPGQTVVIKPNLVVSQHPAGDDLVRYTVTDGPVLRCVAEYALIALQGSGRLLIGDSPIKETDFDKVAGITGLTAIVEALRPRTTTPIELVDFRDFVSQRDEVAMVAGHAQAGDPRGYTEYDLGHHSELDEVKAYAERFRSTAVYYENRMGETHNRDHHRYSIANSVIHADVFINVPKLKTHCKAGVTVALKNLVGICNEKRWLPHHRKGPPDKGGDEYSEKASLGIRLVEAAKDFFVQNKVGRFVYPQIMKVNKLGRTLTGVDLIRRIRDQGDPYQNGGWHGNDTVWRMVLDLNKILRYGQRDGTLEPAVSRPVLTIVDGLWAGEGEGPLKPSAKVAGVLMAGVDPVRLDITAATLMGFDHRRIKLLARALQVSDYPLALGPVDAVRVLSNDADWRTLDGVAAHHLGFVPPRGWRGHFELPPAAGAQTAA